MSSLQWTLLFDLYPIRALDEPSIPTTTITIAYGHVRPATLLKACMLIIRSLLDVRQGKMADARASTGALAPAPCFASLP